jgi:hypothetical protein
MDYSKAARDIASTIEKGSVKLTESQFLILAGGLAVYLEKSYQEGLACGRNTPTHHAKPIEARGKFLDC